MKENIPVDAHDNFIEPACEYVFQLLVENVFESDNDSIQSDPCSYEDVVSVVGSFSEEQDLEELYDSFNPSLDSSADEMQQPEEFSSEEKYGLDSHSENQNSSDSLISYEQSLDGFVDSDISSGDSILDAFDMQSIQGDSSSDEDSPNLDTLIIEEPNTESLPENRSSSVSQTPHVKSKNEEIRSNGSSDKPSEVYDEHLQNIQSPHNDDQPISLSDGFLFDSSSNQVTISERVAAPANSPCSVDSFNPDEFLFDSSSNQSIISEKFAAPANSPCSVDSFNLDDSPVINYSPTPTSTDNSIIFEVSGSLEMNIEGMHTSTYSKTDTKTTLMHESFKSYSYDILADSNVAASTVDSSENLPHTEFSTFNPENNISNEISLTCDKSISNLKRKVCSSADGILPKMPKVIEETAIVDYRHEPLENYSSVLLPCVYDKNSNYCDEYKSEIKPVTISSDNINADLDDGSEKSAALERTKSR